MFFIRNKIFIILFTAICLTPLLAMPFRGDNTQNKANEVKVNKPLLFKENGNLNLNFINQISDWFNTSYGLRNHMITLEHMISAKVFGQSSEEKVILGKDDTLFYKETLDDYEGTNVMTEKELCATVKVLSLIDEYYKSIGIDFAFTIVPNKNSLYPEKMPSYYPENKELSNSELIKKSLSKTNIKYIDLFEAFGNEDKFLYRKTDSHWTDEGAGLACDTIVKSLNKDHEPFFGGKTKTVAAKTGDLFEMLYPAGKDSDTDTVYERDFLYTYERPIRSVEDNFIRTQSDSPNGNLFMFRDSFGNTLHRFLADNFSKAVFCRLMPYNLTLAAQEGTDTVLIEIVERNIDWLLTKGIIFPSPQRETDFPKIENITAYVDFEVSACDELIGYSKVEGQLKNELQNKICDIYITSDNKTYEATPGKDGYFTAFIPECTNTNKIKIYEVIV